MNENNRLVWYVNNGKDEGSIYNRKDTALYVHKRCKELEPDEESNLVAIMIKFNSPEDEKPKYDKLTKFVEWEKVQKLKRKAMLYTKGYDKYTGEIT